MHKCLVPLIELKRSCLCPDLNGFHLSNNICIHVHFRVINMMCAILYSILIPEKGTLCNMLDRILQLNDELGKLGKQSFMQIKYA